jgi:hypothetical protein
LYYVILACSATGACGNFEVLDKLVSKLLMDVRSASVLWAAALQMEAAVDSKILLHRRFGAAQTWLFIYIG